MPNRPNAGVCALTRLSHSQYRDTFCSWDFTSLPLLTNTPHHNVNNWNHCVQHEISKLDYCKHRTLMISSFNWATSWHSRQVQRPIGVRDASPVVKTINITYILLVKHHSHESIEHDHQSKNLQWTLRSYPWIGNTANQAKVNRRLQISTVTTTFHLVE